MDREKEILEVLDKLKIMDVPQLMSILGASQAFCMSQDYNKKETDHIDQAENHSREVNVN